MGRVSLRIKEFPDDGRIWRIDWFGGIERNVQVPTEPKNQLIISPARDSAINFASTNAVDDDERKTITIGVGQLSLVSIGSLWQNQRCLIKGGFKHRGTFGLAMRGNSGNVSIVLGFCA